MANGQVDGLEADLEFSWNQRFDKVSKVILQMNAVFMPMAAVVSGRVWQSLPAADRELITKTVKSTLDAQIDELAGNEPKLVENFKNAPIPIRQVEAERYRGRHRRVRQDLAAQGAGSRRAAQGRRDALIHPSFFQSKPGGSKASAGKFQSEPNNEPTHFLGRRLPGRYHAIQ